MIWIREKLDRETFRDHERAHLIVENIPFLHVYGVVEPFILRVFKRLEVARFVRTVRASKDCDSGPCSWIIRLHDDPLDNETIIL